MIDNMEDHDEEAYLLLHSNSDLTIKDLENWMDTGRRSVFADDRESDYGDSATDFRHGRSDCHCEGEGVGTMPIEKVSVMQDKNLYEFIGGVRRYCNCGKERTEKERKERIYDCDDCHKTKMAMNWLMT